MKVSFRRAFLTGILLVVAATFIGCATTEPDNASARPWGYRGGYDPGLPSMMNEGR